MLKIILNSESGNSCEKNVTCFHFTMCSTSQGRTNCGPRLGKNSIRGSRASIHHRPWITTLLFVIITGHIISSCLCVSLGGGAVCARIPGLHEKQRALCRAAPAALAAAGDGVRMATEECERRFSTHRWNCSNIGGNDVFGHVVIVGSREAAFTYAITSAGVAYAVTAACARGDIPACGCDRKRNQTPPPRTGWRWGGCGADAAYGTRFARRFLDARELEGDARSLMNLHNNRAGRKIVKSSLQTECKCHGVSGSCTMKTCWRALPPFSVVGEALMKKYHRARHVTAAALATVEIKDVQLVLKRSKSYQPLAKRLPKRSELVFNEESPNYCERNLAKGSLGTLGRYCNRTSRGTDGCDLLCCGRGYNTHQYVKKSQCNCQFLWCCKVQCEECIEKREDYTCK